MTEEVDSHDEYLDDSTSSLPFIIIIMLLFAVLLVFVSRESHAACGRIISMMLLQHCLKSSSREKIDRIVDADDDAMMFSLTFQCHLGSVARGLISGVFVCRGDGNNYCGLCDTCIGTGFAL